jgi:hypothetical protein
MHVPFFPGVGETGTFQNAGILILVDVSDHQRRFHVADCPFETVFNKYGVREA